MVVRIRSHDAKADSDLEHFPFDATLRLVVVPTRLAFEKYAT
jgi:hypothetical protein